MQSTGILVTQQISRHKEVFYERIQSNFLHDYVYWVEAEDEDDAFEKAHKEYKQETHGSFYDTYEVEDLSEEDD